MGYVCKNDNFINTSCWNMKMKKQINVWLESIYNTNFLNTFSEKRQKMKLLFPFSLIVNHKPVMLPWLLRKQTQTKIKVLWCRGLTSKQVLYPTKRITSIQCTLLGFRIYCFEEIKIRINELHMELKEQSKEYRKTTIMSWKI